MFKKQLGMTLLIAGSFWFLTGFTGKIEVNEPLNFDVKKGVKNVDEGEYNITLTEKGSRRLQLEIHLEGRRNNPLVEFRIPRNKSLPSDSGDFEITAQESGQAYDATGHVDTDIQEGREQWDQYPCTAWITEYYCWIDRYGYRRCSYRNVAYPGYQDVRFYERVTTRTIEMELINPESNSVAASIDSERTEKRRFNTYMGVCHIR